MKSHGQKTPAHPLPRLRPRTDDCLLPRRPRPRADPPLDQLARFGTLFFKAPDSEEEIEICKFDESGPVQVGPDLTHLAFEVEDMDAFAAHAEKLGYPLSDGPSKTSSGSVIAFIDAPDGYEIELIQPVS
jgi:catechol 2,3-dioxygenase-like lactoylglutathione lyase family enzyme